LAALVFDMRKEVVAATGVTGPAYLFTKDKTATVCDWVQKASAELLSVPGHDV